MKLGIENVKIEKCSAHSLYKFARFVCDEFEISEVLGEFFMPRHENYIGEKTKHYKRLSKYMIDKIKTEGVHFYSGVLGGAQFMNEAYEFILIERYNAVFIVSKKDNTVVTAFTVLEKNRPYISMLKRELEIGSHIDPVMEEKRINRLKALGSDLVVVKSNKARENI